MKKKLEDYYGSDEESEEQEGKEFKAKKALGQNFLINKRIAKDMAKQVKSKTVLEIGGGKGILTNELIENKNIQRLTCVELDQELYFELLKQFKNNPKTVILQGDALAVDFSQFEEITGNIPYYISSPIIVKFLESTAEKAVLMVQKEFAQKLLAKPGEEGWSRLTVMIQAKCSAKILEIVEKFNFEPAPTVDSAIIKLEKKKMPIKLNNDLVNALFHHKNQNVKKSLKHSQTFLKIDKKKLQEFAEKLKCKDEKVRFLDLKKLDEISKEFENKFNRKK